MKFYAVHAAANTHLQSECLTRLLLHFKRHAGHIEKSNNHSSQMGKKTYSPALLQRRRSNPYHCQRTTRGCRPPAPLAQGQLRICAARCKKKRKRPGPHMKNQHWSMHVMGKLSRRKVNSKRRNVVTLAAIVIDVHLWWRTPIFAGLSS